MRTLSLIAMLLLSLSSVIATDVPLGIDGHVYSLDGEPVPSYVWMAIDSSQGNMTTNPGRGGAGRYSIAIPWPKGTIVTVRASNPVHTVEQSIAVTGIVHDLDLFLNMTLPQLPPNITSAPVTETEQDALYAYPVSVFDWNGDAISLAIVNGPAEMYFAGQTLMWTPGFADVGSHDIVVSASDGNDTVMQEFTVIVANVNDAPTLENLTLSIPAGTPLFTYQLNGSDLDGDAIAYTLVSGPSGLNVTSLGEVLFSPPSSGTSIVRVSDGIASSTATLTFTLASTPPSSGGRGGGRGGGGGGGRSPPYTTPGEDRPRQTPFIPPQRPDIAPEDRPHPSEHAAPSIVNVPEPSTIIGAVFNRGNPVKSGFSLSIEDENGDPVALVETGDGPVDNSFTVTLNDVRGKRFRIAPGNRYYDGEAQFTADSLNVVRVDLASKRDPLSLTGLFFSETTGVDPSPLASGIFIIVIVIGSAGLYLRRRLRQ